MHELDDVIQHFGVKGMKWGVRKDRGGSSSKKKKEAKAPKEPGYIKTRINSTKREKSWEKKLESFDSMDSKSRQKVVDRVRLENDYKRLANKDKVGSRGDRLAYRKREKLSDKDLATEVTRLRTKEQMVKQVSQAKAGHIDIGAKVISAVGSAAITYMASGKVDVGKAIESAIDA